MAISDLDLGGTVRRRERDAVTAVYEAYADRVFSYCLTMLRDPHDAADATQETFTRVAERLHQLRDPSKLGPWLFAIARNEVATQGRRRGRTFPVAEPSTDPHYDEVVEGLSRQELVALVWEASDGLSDRDREVMALHLQAGMATTDLGEALGVEPSHARLLVSRMRTRLEQSIGALLLARAGSPECEDLARIVRRADRRFDVLLRKRIARHADRCETCARRRSSLARPSTIVPAALVVAAPAVLRRNAFAATGAVAASTTAPAALLSTLAGRAAIVVGLLVGGGGAVGSVATLDDAVRDVPVAVAGQAPTTPTPAVVAHVPITSTAAGRALDAPSDDDVRPSPDSTRGTVVRVAVPRADAPASPGEAAPPVETAPAAEADRPAFAALTVQTDLGLVGADADVGVQLDASGAAVDAQTELAVAGGAVRATADAHTDVGAGGVAVDAQLDVGIINSVGASAGATIDATGGSGPLVGASADLGLVAVDLGLVDGGEILRLDLGVGSLAGLLGLDP